MASRQFTPQMCPHHQPKELSYIAWFDWCDQMYEIGLEQKQCPKCELWFFPEEMNEPMAKKAYNHGGLILYGAYWPDVPPVMASANADELAMQKFGKQMARLLEPRNHVVITNPEMLPPIKVGEFLDLKGYEAEVKFVAHQYTCTITKIP